MSDEHAPTLRLDRELWLADGGDHYRELAEWLREMAASVGCQILSANCSPSHADISPEPITYSGRCGAAAYRNREPATAVLFVGVAGY